jgi:hypothetical protein
MIVDSASLTCSDCGIPFEVPSHWKHAKQNDHSTFWCPNGHKQHFPSESSEERFRRERDMARQEVARVEQEAQAARTRAEKAEKAHRLLKRRTSAGTCPCCKRTFNNMATHIEQKHPEYIKEADAHA